MIVSNALNNGYKLLKENNIKSYKIDTEILLSYVLKKKKEDIILNHDQILELNNYNEYLNLIKLRLSKKPIAQIVNSKNFWKDKSTSQRVIKEKKLYEELVSSYEKSINNLKDFDELNKLAIEERNTSFQNELLKNIKVLRELVKKK